MENFPKSSEKLPEILVANGDKKYSYYLSDLVKKRACQKSGAENLHLQSERVQ